MTYDAVTTFAPQHWESHARRCVETFDQYWSDVQLYPMSDADLAEGSDWLASFKARHQYRPTANYRLDAVRFSHKIAAIELAYRRGTSECLIWIDADCVTHAPADSAWLDGLVRGADFAFLKRASKYSECGFMVFRRGKACDELIAKVTNLYRTDALFALPEWHDCMALDRMREEMGDRLNWVSLSGDAENTAHPLINGPLGERLDHLKGKRKQLGRSKPSDLKVKRREAYWNG